MRTKEENLGIYQTKNLSTQEKTREKNREFDARQKSSQLRKKDQKRKLYGLENIKTKNL